MFGQRFSLLLKKAMEEYGVGSTKLAEILKEQGVNNISNKRISEYTRAVSTPSLEKAKVIMSVLEYPIDEEDLKESLALNRELIRDEHMQDTIALESNNYARALVVRVRLRNITPGQPTIDTERRVMDRARDLFGTQDIARYVEKLISKDLQEDILKGGK